MGRGSSKSGGGGGAVTSVVSQQGVAIDLTQTPLIYGPKDTSLSKAQRTAIEAFEAKRVTRDVEYAMLLDANGNSTIPYSAGDIKGKTGHVNINQQFWRGAEILSHNHPRGKKEPGVLGGTFSDADLFQFSAHRQLRTIRATAAEGTYSMTKGASFNRSGFDNYVGNASKTHYGAYKKAERQLKADYKAGKISHGQYSQANDNAFNKFLINLHNDFLAGQKTYGYTYTLEKTK